MPEPVSPVRRLFTYAVEQITAAAAELWPGDLVRLGKQVPSVTSYIHRVDVGGRAMYAKYSLMGTSLVSVLCGAHGGWNLVVDAQRAYVQSADALLAREAAQLRRFAEHAQLSVCSVAGYARGALFTDAVIGRVALEELVIAEPQATGELLRRAWGCLARVHATAPDGWPVMAERCITDTFTRKFLGPNGSVYLERLDRAVSSAAVGGLRRLVHLLRTRPVTRATTTLVFGDVKPEHIMFGGGEPVFLDPGVHLATNTSDLAKLVSRLLLVLLSRPDKSATRPMIMPGISGFVHDVMSTVDDMYRDEWLTDVLTLMAQDVANIVSTYLSAPARFPLPRSAVAVVKHAPTVLSVIGRVAVGLTEHADPSRIWERLTREVAES